MGDLGSRLRELRKQKGMKQKDLALMAGISGSYLSDIEVGRTDPSVKTLFKLSEALGITMEEIFKGL